MSQIAIVGNRLRGVRRAIQIQILRGRAAVISGVLSLGLLALQTVSSSPAAAQALHLDGVEAPIASAGTPTREANKLQDFAFYIQSTVVYQYHPAFRSPYQGTNSLISASEGKETFDLTLYAGLRVWKGAEFWINPEVDQGFGLSNTLGVAGFPTGEAYKVGANQPYGRTHRAFLRQTLNLGGDVAAVDADLNQLGGSQSENRVVLTVGKFSAVDVFDTNAYAHDPRNDFLNWSIIDSAAFDYAANAWGYTYGVAGERYQGSWAFRLGLFDLSTVPNSAALDTRVLPQYQMVAEAEKRYQFAGRAGIVRLLGFGMHANIGKYDQASSIAQLSGQPPDIAAVRSPHTKFGVALNLQQQLASDIGLFARVSTQQGQYEAFDFTDVSQSFAVGLSVTGSRWNRTDDTFGAGAVINRESGAALRFFNTGGLGILVGDGQLPHPGSERAMEMYYRFVVTKGVQLTLDYQYIDNPAYNRDRGPVSALAMRLHAQFGEL